MFRRIGQFALSAVLALVCGNALPQILSEFRDSAPGSLLFGVLQVVIASSSAAAVVGTLRGARWTPRAIAVCGTAAVVLLLAQPVFDPMDGEGLRSLLLGAGIVTAVTAGLVWGARRLAGPVGATITADPPGPRALQPPMRSPHPRPDPILDPSATEPDRDS